MKEIDLKEWFNRAGDVFTLSKLEKAAGLSRGCLYFFCKGERELKETDREKIIVWIDKIFYNGSKKELVNAQVNSEKRNIKSYVPKPKNKEPEVVQKTTSDDANKFLLEMRRKKLGF